MLRIAERPLAASAAKVLADLQADVLAAGAYPDQVAAAAKAWGSKTSTAAKAAAFRNIRETLARMSIGPIRCAYCEDSLADEIEHIRPKNLFPEVAFVWANYLFACGPCNGPKSNRHGTVVNDAVEDFIRKKGDPLVAPPAGVSGLINPRSENPLPFLDLDIGGTAPDGLEIEGTFDFLPAAGLSPADAARADYTIRVLGLNREVMRVARQNAFGGFRARLWEYVEKREAGAAAPVLKKLEEDLLGTPHLTVFAEMRRQRAVLPEIDDLLNRAPEAAGWPLVA